MSKECAPKENRSYVNRRTGEEQPCSETVGFYSAANKKFCVNKKITPLIAAKRQQHNAWLAEHATPNSPEEERLRRLYATRESTTETVFGVIKHVMGFKQFSLRSLRKVAAETQLVFAAYNLKRLYTLRML